MFYHGTNVGGLKELKPHGSNEGKFVYLTTEKNRVLPYCANPIQIYCDKKYGKGKVNPGYRIAMFDFKNGTMSLKELYSGYLRENFEGQTAYIYSFDNAMGVVNLGKPCVYGSPHSLQVENVEVLGDVYKEIEKLEKEGRIVVRRYEDYSDEEKRSINEKYFNEYLNTKNRYYKEFLFDKMPYIKEKLEKERARGNTK